MGPDTLKKYPINLDIPKNLQIVLRLYLCRRPRILDLPVEHEDVGVVGRPVGVQICQGGYHGHVVALGAPRGDARAYLLLLYGAELLLQVRPCHQDAGVGGREVGVGVTAAWHACRLCIPSV